MDITDLKIIFEILQKLNEARTERGETEEKKNTKLKWIWGIVAMYEVMVKKSTSHTKTRKTVDGKQQWWNSFHTYSHTHTHIVNMIMVIKCITIAKKQEILNINLSTISWWRSWSFFFFTFSTMYTYLLLRVLCNGCCFSTAKNGFSLFSFTTSSRLCFFLRLQFCLPAT